MKLSSAIFLSTRTPRAPTAKLVIRMDPAPDRALIACLHPLTFRRELQKLAKGSWQRLT